MIILPGWLTNQYELKFGIGRIWVKYFQAFTGITSALVFFLSMMYILGMRHRKRNGFYNQLRKLTLKRLPCLAAEIRLGQKVMRKLDQKHKAEATLMAKMMRGENGEKC